MVLYLSGVVRPDMPAMLQPRMGNLPPAGQVWAADNGCFSSPATYSDAGFLGWLARLLPHASSCLFAVAPDVVGDAAATLVRSLPMLPRIREAGYRAAFVAQDGLTLDTTPWDAFDALFIGGTTAWKTSETAYEVCQEAKRRGKWVHMGRVNSLRRLRVAEAFGCDSVDGTFIKWAPDLNALRVARWLLAMDEHPTLWAKS